MAGTAKNLGIKGLSGATGPCRIVAGTRVRTLDGVLPVEFLVPGDRIVCRHGARQLLRITSTCQDRITLVRVRASTLGHDRPDRDLLVAPDQQILIRDWRAKALYGRDVAAIPAARLVDGEFILNEARQNTPLFTLHFSEEEVIYTEGLELVCPVRAPAKADLPA